MRHDLFRRHVLGQRGEAHQVGEQHADGLSAHPAQRLVALGQLVHDLGREVTRQVRALALGLGPLGDQDARASHQQRQPGRHDQERDDLALVLQHRDEVRIEIRGQPARQIEPAPGRDARAGHHPQEAERPRHRTAQTRPQQQARAKRERHLHQQDEEEHEVAVAQRYGRRQRDRSEGIGDHEYRRQHQRVDERENIRRHRWRDIR